MNDDDQLIHFYTYAGFGWTDFATADSAGYALGGYPTGVQIGMAYDGLGNLHVAYWRIRHPGPREIVAELRYGVRNPSQQWLWRTLASQFPYGLYTVHEIPTSLAIDPTGRPVILTTTGGPGARTLSILSVSNGWKFEAIHSDRGTIEPYARPTLAIGPSGRRDLSFDAGSALPRRLEQARDNPAASMPALRPRQ